MRLLQRKRRRSWGKRDPLSSNLQSGGGFFAGNREVGELEIALLFPLCVASFAPFLFALSPRLYWTTAKGWMRWEVKERKDFYFWQKSGTCTVAFWLPAPPADFWIILYSPCTVSRRLHSNRGQVEPYLAGLFPSLWR